MASLPRRWVLVLPAAAAAFLWVLTAALESCAPELARELPLPAPAQAPPDDAGLSACGSAARPSPELSFGDALTCLGEAPPPAQGAWIAHARELAGGDELRGAYVDHHAALYAQGRGELQRALELGRRSAEVFSRHERRAWLAAGLHNQGVLAAALGRGQQALAYFGRALDLRREPADREARAALLTQIGWVLHSLGDSKGAVRQLATALELRTTDYGRAVTLDRLGSVYRDSRRPRRARRCYRESLALFEHLDNPLRGHVLANLGWLDLGLDRPAAAEEWLRAALPLLHGLGDRDAEAHVLFGLAEAARQRGDLEIAVFRQEMGLSLVARLRHDAPGARSLRSTFGALRHDHDVRHVAMLVALHRRWPARGYDRRAFRAEERRRARGLLDVLGGQGSLAGADAEGSRLLREIGDDIGTLEGALRLAPSAAERRRLEARLHERLAELEMLRAASAGGPLPPRPRRVGVDEARALLGPDTTLLAYSLGDERSFLFVLDRASLDIFELPPRDRIERAARELYGSIVAPGDILAEDQARVVAAELSRMLLAPVARRLGERILVLKDGALHRVPFAALPRPGGGGRLLVEDHVVVQAPSLSSLRLLERRAARRGAPATTVTVVAPDAGAGRSAGGSRFPALRAVDAEVRAIVRSAGPAGTRVLAGPAASRRRLEEVGRSRILHFATHAEMSERFGELSAILLTGDGGGDDLLRLHEVFDLSLDTDLVVLSACQTALGDILGGEGMVGMTHGFLGAGAQAVVVSLWQVDDRSTAALMERFYAGVFAGEVDTAAALRAAQLSLLADGRGRWSAPYHWAAFELQGRSLRLASEHWPAPGV